MDATRLPELLDRLGVRRFPRIQRGDNWYFCCPLHADHRPSAGINTRKEVFGCMAGCGGMSIPWLLREVLHLPLPEAADLFHTRYGGGLISWGDLQRKPDKPRQDSFLTETQLESLPLADLSDRWIRPDTVRKYGVRCFPKYLVLLYPGWTYPERRYAGYLVRWLNHPKLKHTASPGFQKRLLLYGLWESGLGNRWRKGRRNERVVVVEGPVDALAVSQAGMTVVGLMGSSLSLDQARLLKNARDVVLFLDNDAAGWHGQQRAVQLLGSSVRLWEAVYPADTWGADPANLQPDELRLAVEHAVRVTSGSTKKCLTQPRSLAY